MTRDQIRLVQASFRNVLPIREKAAALFYDRLFEIDPGTRGLFADTDLRSQGGKLMAAIGMVVHALDAPESMVEKLKELARRHVNYGVENRHYATVGAALLWTLQVGLGEAFTPELRDAWASAYNMLSERMMEAARARRRPMQQQISLGSWPRAELERLGEKTKRPMESAC